MGKISKKKKGKNFLKKIKLGIGVNVLIAVLILILTVIIGINKFNEIQEKKRLDKESEIEAQEKMQEAFQSRVITEIQTLQHQFNTDDWKDYQTNWYGFSMKYPQNWKRPVPKSIGGNSNAEYKYEFRNSEDTPGIYSGFDVIIYNTSKIDELSKTDEFPKLKDSNNDPKCETIGEHLIETGDYAAEEIYIPSTNDCYESAMFFSVTKGNYIYNIVPALKTDAQISGDPMKEASDSIPEIFAAISTFENVKIVRVTAQDTAKIKAPKPVSFKKDELGRRVCAKKNDKPGFSKQNKGKHLDMECCLDPDEYPNPHCYYDPKKYGKYL